MAAAVVMRATHRVARVTAAPAAALMSMPREICDSFVVIERVVSDFAESVSVEVCNLVD